MNRIQLTLLHSFMAFSIACIAFGCEARKKNKELIDELYQPIHPHGVDVPVIVGQEDFYTIRKNQVLSESAGKEK